MKKIILILFVLINTDLFCQCNYSSIGNPESEETSISQTNFVNVKIDGDNNPYVSYIDIYKGYKPVVKKFTNNKWTFVGEPFFSAGNAHMLKMAINVNNEPYVIYQDWYNNSRATVKKFNGTNWMSVGIEGFTADMIWFPNIAISPTNTPFISFSDGSSNGNASVMKYDGSNWVYVGNPGFSSTQITGTKIIFDKLGNLYCLFSESNNSYQLSLMKYNGSSWVYVGTPRFSIGGSYQFDIDFNSINEPYVVYISQGNPLIQKYNSNGWNIVGNTNISIGSIEEPKIAIDKLDSIYILYSDAGATGKPVVKKLNSNNLWLDFNSYPSLGWSLSLDMVIDTTGKVIVAFQEPSNANKAAVMKSSNNSWKRLGPNGITDSQMIKSYFYISKNNTKWVLVQDYFNNLKVLKYNGTSWINHGTTYNNGSYYGEFKMVVDNNNNAYILNMPTSDYQTYILKNDGITWSYLGNSSVLQYINENTDMALDSINQLYFIYSDFNNNNQPKVKMFDGLNWNNIGLNNITNSEVLMPRILINSQNKPIVIFQDSLFGYLLTAMQLDNNNNWAIIGTPGFSNSQTNPSITLDNYDRLVVGYTSSINNEAYVQYFDGINWQFKGSLAQTNHILSEVIVQVNNQNEYFIAHAEGSEVKDIIRKYNGLNWEMIDSNDITTSKPWTKSFIIDNSNVINYFYQNGGAYIIEYNCGGVGINNTIKTDKSINVFPNPFTNYININSDFDTEFSIYNIYGKVIQKGSLKKGNSIINTIDFKVGIYILNLKNNLVNNSFKILKE